MATMHPTDQILGVGDYSEPIPRGEILGIHLGLAGGIVEGSLAELRWLGQTTPIPFTISVPLAAPVGGSTALVTLARDRVAAGVIRFSPFFQSLVAASPASVG